MFTIEPMLVEGSPEVFTWKDGWTVATKDNGRCAQFEHTILIHDDGAEVLTLSLFVANFSAFSTLQYSFSSLYLSATFFGCFRLLYG